MKTTFLVTTLCLLSGCAAIQSHSFPPEPDPIESGALNVSGIVEACSIRVDGDVVTLEPCKGD